MDLSRLGPFAMEQRLGGAQSSVYRAIHVQRRLPAAVKVFPIPFSVGEDARKMFLRECEELKRLKHPCIVRCFGGGFAERVAYLAFEFIDGESLDSLLQRRGRLPWEHVVEISQQICAALEYAHNKKLFHTRLSPAEVLLRGSRTKLIGFRWQRGASPFQSQGGDTAARRKYWAPEQFRAEPITHRTDLYALGCLMHEMLTGKPPFNGSPEEVEQGHLHQTPARVTTDVFDCPVWLDSLIRQLLAKDPDKRPYTAVAVGLALKETRANMAAGASVVEHAAGGLSALRTGADRQQARKLLGRKERRPRQDDSPFYERAWFLALCLLATIAGLAWMLQPPSAEKLMQRAQALLASEENIDAYRARDDYLVPLVKRYPESALAAEAGRLIDDIDIREVESRLRARLRLGRDLETEPERLLAEVWKYDQFGDRVTALEKYQSMANLLEQGADADQPPTRIYIHIARANIERLMNEATGPGDRAAFLKDRLARADQLAADGKTLDAQQIWRSIDQLYSGNREVETLVQQARARLGVEGRE